MSRYRYQSAGVRALSRERREAVRPLRAMVEGTPFSIRYLDLSWATDDAHKYVLLMLDCDSRRVPWGRAGDVVFVAGLMRDMAMAQDEHHEQWSAQTWDAITALLGGAK